MYPLTVGQTVYDYRLIFPSDPTCQETYPEVPGEVIKVDDEGFHVKWEAWDDPREEYKRTAYDNGYSWDHLKDGIKLQKV